MSSHQERFEKKAEETENIIESLLKKYSYRPVSILIDSPAKYPEKDDWLLLHRHLDEIFKSKRNASDPFFALVTDKPEWIVNITPIDENDQRKYHPNYFSYNLIISCIYHKNEVDNLISKINDACSNLAKHSAKEDQNVCNFLMLHCPPNASSNYCKKWLLDYFTEYPEKPITGILLYQPSVASLKENFQTTIISHFVEVILREDKFVPWLPAGFHFDFTIPVGVTSNTPAENKLIVQHADGRTEEILLNERYTYQHGNHYLMMLQGEDGSWHGNLARLGSGIFTHSII